MILDTVIQTKYPAEVAVNYAFRMDVMDALSDFQ